MNDNTPGCFGSIVIRSLETGECKQCLFNQLCESQSQQTAMALRDELGVEELNLTAEKKRKPRVVKRNYEKRPEGVSAKGNQLLKSLASKGYDKGRLMNCYRRREFDADLTPRFVGVTLQALYSNDGVIEKSQLKKFFEKELGWGAGTASSHVAIVTSALTYMDVLQDNGSKLVINE